ncbi:MAG: type II secretion system protein GspG [Candidatus Sumerlaeota bacterium]|nr:type II secretion system protein GspG [Candidatus Sumerlaeota bacterium]
MWSTLINPIPVRKSVRFALTAIWLLVASVGRTAPAPPAMVDSPDVVLYAKIAPLEVVWQKLSAYAQAVAPGKVTDEQIHRFPAGQWMVKFKDALDTSKNLSAFILQDGEKYSAVFFMPLKEGEGAKLQDDPTVAAMGDHALYSPDSQIMIKAAGLDDKFRVINDEPPAADIRVCVNVAALWPAAQAKLTGLGAMFGGSAQGQKAMEALAKGAQVDTVSLDVQMAREGVELQLGVFPKAQSELAAFCSQPAPTAFPLAAYLPGVGAFRAVWRIESTQRAEAYEPDGAMEAYFPEKGFASQLSLTKVKDNAKALAMAKQNLSEALGTMGGSVDQAYVAAARQVGGISVDKLDMAAAMKQAMGAASQGRPMPAMDFSQIVPAVEIAVVNGCMVSGTVPELIDATINKIQAGAGAQAAPLAAQKTYPGGAHFYADLDVIKAMLSMSALFGMTAAMAGPGVTPPDLSALKEAKAPPVTMTATLSGGVAQARTYVPLELAKVIGGVAGKMNLGEATGFGEAQGRSEVSRAQADMRSLATAIESYSVDWNAYPPSAELAAIVQEGENGPKNAAALYRLTTPIAYISRALPDPFSPDGAPYFYYRVDPKSDPGLAATGNKWFLWSVGPDGVSNIAAKTDLGPSKLSSLLYNPASGPNGPGDLVRSSEGAVKPPQAAGPGAVAPAIPGAAAPPLAPGAAPAVQSFVTPKPATPVMQPAAPGAAPLGAPAQKPQGGGGKKGGGKGKKGGGKGKGGQ